MYHSSLLQVRSVQDVVDVYRFGDCAGFDQELQFHLRGELQGRCVCSWFEGGNVSVAVEEFDALEIYVFNILSCGVGDDFVAFFRILLPVFRRLEPGVDESARIFGAFLQDCVAEDDNIHNYPRRVGAGKEDAVALDTRL